MFPLTFLQILIYLSLIWTGLGAVILTALLFKDARQKSIW